MAAACSSSDDATTDGDTPPPVVDVAGLFATAQDSKDDADAAAAVAAAVVKTAMEASLKLSTMSVNGDSMTATMNAQAVLDAQTNAAKAGTDAQAALDAAEMAETDAADLDNDSLDRAIAAAVEAAEKAIKVATESSESAELKEARALVDGADADMPMSATDHGKAAAMDVGAALMPASLTDGGRNTETAPHGTEAPADTVMNAVTMNNHTGMTWKEIVGDTTKMRIANTDTDTNEVDAASVDGMTLTSAAPETGEDAFADDGLQVAATYKGIVGTIFCVGADCTVTENAEDDAARDLAGSWYFTPMSPMAYYEKVGDATDYTAETNYAQYGHWLTVDTDDGNIVVNTFARGGAGTETNSAGLVYTTMEDEPDSATYNGTAVGMSLHKTVDEDGEIASIYSGAFTAAVELTLRFSDMPADVTLGGTIDGFQTESEGMNVDSDWTVELERRTFTGTLPAARTVATGRDGEWSATAYGDTDARPTGIFGGFNAHFTDGHAAGAYAAE